MVNYRHELRLDPVLFQLKQITTSSNIASHSLQTDPEILLGQGKQDVVARSNTSDNVGTGLSELAPAPDSEAENTEDVTPFQVGDRLEAIDRKYPTLVCVAHVKDIRADGWLLISFDGWDTSVCKIPLLHWWFVNLLPSIVRLLVQP